MRAWAYMLGGLLVWAAHFFALYFAASLFETSTTTRLVTAFATLAALAAAGWLTLAGWKGYRRKEDSNDVWIQLIAALSGATALVAVLWQGLPALLI